MSESEDTERGGIEQLFGPNGSPMGDGFFLDDVLSMIRSEVNLQGPYGRNVVCQNGSKRITIADDVLQDLEVPGGEEIDQYYDPDRQFLILDLGDY